jgi:Ca2+-binding RTX toxin-like protein
MRNTTMGSVGRRPHNLLLPSLKSRVTGIGSTALLVASTALVVLLSSGIALALNAVDCQGGGMRCVGTNGPDLMRGSGGMDAMYGRDGADTLKGQGKGDDLLGRKGNDKLLGGTGQDVLIGGPGDDGLRGEEALDVYYFEGLEWGRDTISEASPRNILRLPNREGFGGPVTTNLASDSGPLPEVSNAESGSTVDWDGWVVPVVIGSTGDDTVAGNDIFDGEGLDTDYDTISGAGGNDLIDVQDGGADDKVECGEGHDTVYFDQELELVVPDECEEKNPIPNELEGRQAAPDRVEFPQTR